MNLFEKSHFPALSLPSSSTRRLHRFRRQTYVTPKSYLFLLKCYDSLYVSRRKDLRTMQNQLSVGLDKMQEAAESALEMGKILAVQAKEVEKATNKAKVGMNSMAGSMPVVLRFLVLRISSPTFFSPTATSSLVLPPRPKLPCHQVQLCFFKPLLLKD